MNLPRLLKGGKGHGSRLLVFESTYLIPVDVIEAIQEHLHHFLDLRQRELDVGVAEEAGQVVLAEVEHQVDAALATVVGRGCGDQGVKDHTRKILPSLPLEEAQGESGGQDHRFYSSYFEPVFLPLREPKATHD